MNADVNGEHTAYKQNPVVEEEDYTDLAPILENLYIASKMVSMKVEEWKN